MQDDLILFLWNRMGCVLSLVAGRGNGNTGCWLGMPSHRANRSLFVHVPSLPHFLCAFSSSSMSSSPTELAHSGTTVAAHLLGRNNQKARNGLNLHQIRKTTNLENQVISYESGPKQQPLLLTIPTNYSWFMSQS